jgi:hypothetical protein
MRKILWMLALGLAFATPAFAEAPATTLAVGYSPSVYLEGGAGVVPLGINFSASTAALGRGAEADLAYHRDQGTNTITAAIGPRMAWGGDTSTRYLHMMLMLRHDSISGVANNSGGAMMGFGVDLGRMDAARLRLGADLQIVFDSGYALKVLRMTVGAAF